MSTMSPEDARQHSPAAERNAGPILAELLRVLPAGPQAAGGPRQMLEIASGTGQHAARFSTGLPGWCWQPSDGDARSLPSIAAWCAGLPSVLPPLVLDVMAPQWPGVAAQLDAIFCANLIHISPAATTPALMQGAARHLVPQGLLITYGPYLEDAVPTAPGNIAFDADLRSRNPAWGLRRLGDVADAARACGLRLSERVALPANNLLLVFERAA
jgi:hypothetical protein